MGLFQYKEAGRKGKLGIWHITETIDELQKMRSFSKEELEMLDSFSYEHRKKEWMCERILSERLTGIENLQITYDENNKPFIKDSKLHISLSHSHDMLAVIIDKQNTGIDIERIRPNVMKIKEKFMSDAELGSLKNENIEEQLTLYWCVKESLYKLYGKKKLAFKENLLVEPFDYFKDRTIRSQISIDSIRINCELHYSKISANNNNYMHAFIVNQD